MVDAWTELQKLLGVHLKFTISEMAANANRVALCGHPLVVQPADIPSRQSTATQGLASQDDDLYPCTSD